MALSQSRCVRPSRGFSLVELMISVALVGIMATLATAGVTRYLAVSKTAEATNALGAISRAVHAAAARELMDGDVLALQDSSTGGVSKTTGSGSGNGKGKGATVTFGTLGLCDDAEAVPSSLSMIARKKYQPKNSPGNDYETGDALTGWRCLKYSSFMPQYYQYSYSVGGPPISVTLPHGGTPNGAVGADKEWSAYARGDLDGDGKLSWFIMAGYLQDGEVHSASGIATQDEDE